VSKDPNHDPHAVAGLLKLYLRELPTPLFDIEGKSLFAKINGTFIRVIMKIELDSRFEKLELLRDMINQLPIINYALLRVLMGHLLRIVKDSNTNKMTVRNMGIVFSPTLNIPANLFGFMLSEFTALFSRQVESDFLPNKIDDIYEDSGLTSPDAMGSFE